ncbi:hypothetical protein DFAR_4030010 [Desulfarculales bacterium]
MLERIGQKAAWIMAGQDPADP